MENNSKTMFKIRKMLGNDYHLCEINDINNDYLWQYEWYLYKYYDDPNIYYSPDNKKIMSSETNTIEELYEYAKKHKKTDCLKVMLNTIIVINVCHFILIALEMFFIHNKTISNILLGSTLTTLLFSLVLVYVSKKNTKLALIEFEETLEKLVDNKYDK